MEQVLILAAGQGTRMRPLTHDIPKPLIKVNGISMLDRILDKVNKIPSVQKIVINGYYLSEKIEDHIKSLDNDKIIFSKEIEKLETGGGLLKALEFFDQTKPILIINGDVVWNEESVLPSVIDHFDDNNMDILLGLNSKNSFLGYDGKGDFNLDKDSGNIISGEVNDFVYTGIQIFHPRILKNLELPKPPFSVSYFFKNEQEKIRVRGLELKNKFFHIGTKEALEKYQNLID